jgi:site-specific DNA-methyltransferase (adenine-specific)
MNRLYFGDNLHVLREHIADASVDLIYLDPPFNSKRDYNLLFKTPKGHESDAQITAFEDSWHWGEQAEREFNDILRQSNTDVAELMRALRSFLGENDMMAYLVMMANRLLELHRVLKPTGSLYLHCDPTASHYLKIVLDGVFGVSNYRNEIIWQRTSAGKPIYRNLPKNSDTIFWYTKTDGYKFDPPTVDLTAEDISTFSSDDLDGRGRYNTQPIINPGDRPNLKYTYVDKNGREWPSPKNGWRFNEDRMRQLEGDNRLAFMKSTIREKYYLADRQAKGKQVPNIWIDIPIVSGVESLGYPTQKPIALLERIIQASSNEGDVVLDPFCGCGTAVDAAQALGRRWIGIDITHLAIALIEKRLKDRYPYLNRSKAEKATAVASGVAEPIPEYMQTFEVIGTPEDLGGARDLAFRDKYQFQWWACSLVNAQPYQGKKKGADGGIDGLIFFQDDRGVAKKIVVSVKGGDNVNVAMVRDLAHVVAREKAEIGLFVTLADSTKPMTTEAIKEGFYKSPATDAEFPRIQILTIAGLLNGTERARYPDLAQGGHTFKKAKVDPGKAPDQTGLFGG